MSIIRQKSICLVHNYHCGILSLLPNVVGHNRHYSLARSREPQQISLLKRVPRLTKWARNLSAGIIESPLGPCPKIPNQNLVEYVFKDVDQWMDDTAAVSKTYF